MKTEKPKFRIKKNSRPNFKEFYVCEERHWFWGWRKMLFLIGNEFSTKKFYSINDAQYEIDLEIKRRKGDLVEIVWEK